MFFMIWTGDATAMASTRARCARAKAWRASTARRRGGMYVCTCTARCSHLSPPFPFPLLTQNGPDRVLLQQYHCLVLLQAVDSIYQVYSIPGSFNTRDWSINTACKGKALYIGQRESAIRTAVCIVRVQTSSRTEPNVFCCFPDSRSY